jgi:F-box interacting protein
VDPATGEVLVTIPRLKKSPTPYETIEDFTTRLNTTTAFGRAIPSGAYKVVRLVHGDSCWVSCLGDDTGWKPRHPPEARVVASYPGSLTVVNGILYVLTSEEEMLGVLHWDMIHCFDLESEEWKTSIQGPMRSSADKVENKTKGMVKLDDALCIVQRSPLNTWLVWLLTDPAKGTWVKAYTIPVNLTFDLLMPLTVMRDGRKLLFCACNDVMTISELHVYDPLTRTCTPLAKFPSNLVGNAGLCNLHLECFVSPKISIVSAQSV